MRNRIIAIAFLLSSAFFAGTVNAQTKAFKAQVPFPFVVGNTTLPAGTYQIQRLLGQPGEKDEVGMIVIRGADQRVYEAVLTKLMQKTPEISAPSQLVFANRAGEHYLSEVRVQGERKHHIPNTNQATALLTLDFSQQNVVLAELH